jgi:cellulose synthase/poly-beta-1,6-N-acetylglucosamine synthase-like glycosyltransferase/peptidoglycan/xylan/chitin deacetylase (PgdA/CDA1 family)/spore germination protein YaaH
MDVHYKYADPKERIEGKDLPVFSDPMRSRSRKVSLLAGAFFIFVVFWVVALGLHVLKVEGIEFDRSRFVTSSAAPLFATDDLSPDVDAKEAGHDYMNDLAQPTQALPPSCEGARGRGDALLQGSRDIFAFLPMEPDWAYTSLEKNCAQIDVLVPAWYVLSENGAAVRDIASDFHDAGRIRQLIKKNRDNFALMPSISLPGVNSFSKVIALLGTETLRQGVVDELTRFAVDKDFEGICLDTTGFPLEMRDVATKLMQQLKSAFTTANLKTCSIIDVENEFWLEPDLIEASDRAVVTMIRQPFAGSSPAPVAPQQWFEETADFVASVVPSEKIVFALGTGGFDWETGAAEPIWTDYTSILSQVSLQDGQVRFFDTDLNSQAIYIDEDQNRHFSWFLDAATFHNQLRTLEKYGLAGVAVWTLGREDPGIWDVLALQGAPFPELQARLEAVSVADYLRYFGKGTFFQLSSEAVTGHRNFPDYRKDGLIHAQEYSVLPKPILIERFGEVQSNQISLTFDDGPDPVYTEQILDVLAEKGVKATFFVVGQNIGGATGVLQRMVREGHMLGSHSFFHPKLEELGTNRVTLELNSLQRVVAGLTGRNMQLYRTPYGKSVGPVTADHANPLRIATSLGYVEMGADIVTYDWTKIAAKEIVEHVRKAVHEENHVVMLHDSGGDRTATVEALGMMIDEMRAEGLTFVSAPEILGLSQLDLMPLDDSIAAKMDGVSFKFLFSAKSIFIALFWTTVALGIMRSISILVLALSRRPIAPSDPNYEPSVTVVVAAYNEAKVIEESINTILASDYDNFHVLVIDDGSTDGTADLVRERFKDDRRVIVYSQENGGKWRALNTAYRFISTDIVVAIDADTVLHKDAIRRLVAPFSDPNVGAVAGNVKVGNRLNLLTRLQGLEYIVSQNLERRAFDKINGMLVVPGAIGAWRVAAVKAVGGYSGDTLAEDADLTVSIQRKGYKVRFVENAVSVTEAPATLIPFLKQRLRWTLGMMQMGWKHRGCIAERRSFGLVSLNDLQIFGVLFALFAPIADMVLLTTIGIAISEFIAGRPPLDPNGSSILIAGYVMLPLMDVLMAVTAVRLERRCDRSESYRQLWVLPFQRVFYRQLLYFTVYRSVSRAISGKLAKWGTLTRMGTVKLTQMT